MNVTPFVAFESEQVALHPVAGIPCAARAVLALIARGEIDGDAQLMLAAAGGWSDRGLLEAELKRLAPSIKADFATFENASPDQFFDGVAAAADRTIQRPELISSLPRHSLIETRAILAAEGKRILAETAKPTDGLVSQRINRPISQFLSFHCLKLRWMRPVHATIAAALFGLAMAVCLFCGGQSGLIAGAILYQVSSIIDGVDGEVARATMRSSKWGATLDTTCDAVTNFAFITGVCFNIWRQGAETAAIAGLAGLACLTAGLAILGAQSLRAGGPLSVDKLKHDALTSESRLFKATAKLASRDVYALVLAALIVTGFAGPAMIVFGTVATVWFATVTIMLTRRSLSR